MSCMPAAESHRGEVSPQFEKRFGPKGPHSSGPGVKRSCSGFQASIHAILKTNMNWQDPETDSSANESDSNESIAASPTASVRSYGSYVRSRQNTNNRVSFSPPGSNSYGAGIPQDPRYDSPPATEDRRRNVRIRFEEFTDSQRSSGSRSPPSTPRYRSTSIPRRRSRSWDYPYRGRRAPSQAYSSYTPYYSVDSRTSSPSVSSVSSAYGQPSPSIIRHKDILTRLQSHGTPSNAPSHHSISKVHADFADASDEEQIKVHHIINIRMPPSIHNHNEELHPRLRSRVFTHQSSFRPDENFYPETYRISHTRLVPGEDDHMHDIAVLTYDEGATVTEPETQWM
jgi:hypothetical protein